MDQGEKLAVFIDSLGADTDAEFARQMLEAHNWDIEAALLTVTGGEQLGGPGGAGGRRGPAHVGQPLADEYDDEGYRAPIRSYHDQLIGPEQDFFAQAFSPLGYAGTGDAGVAGGRPGAGGQGRDDIQRAIEASRCDYSRHADIQEQAQLAQALKASYAAHAQADAQRLAPDALRAQRAEQDEVARAVEASYREQSEADVAFRTQLRKAQEASLGAGTSSSGPPAPASRPLGPGAPSRTPPPASPARAAPAAVGPRAPAAQRAPGAPNGAPPVGALARSPGLAAGPSPGLPAAVVRTGPAAAPGLQPRFPVPLPMHRAGPPQAAAPAPQPRGAAGLQPQPVLSAHAGQPRNIGLGAVPAPQPLVQPRNGLASQPLAPARVVSRGSGCDGRVSIASRPPEASDMGSGARPAALAGRRPLAAEDASPKSPASPAARAGSSFGIARTGGSPRVGDARHQPPSLASGAAAAPPSPAGLRAQSPSTVAASRTAPPLRAAEPGRQQPPRASGRGSLEQPEPERRRLQAEAERRAREAEAVEQHRLAAEQEKQAQRHAQEELEQQQRLAEAQRRREEEAQQAQRQRESEEVERRRRALAEAERQRREATEAERAAVEAERQRQEALRRQAAAETEARRREAEEAEALRRERREAEEREHAAQKAAQPEEPKADGLVQALVALRRRHEADPSGLATCLQTLRAYINNLARNPSDAKFQRINCDNNAFRTRVAAFEGSIAVLEACGFTADGSSMAVSADFVKTKGPRLWDALAKVDVMLEQVKAKC